jgi:hypothetical protein
MILEIAGLALFLAVAAFLLVPMFRSKGREAVQSRWPRVPAEVLQHRLREKGNSGFEEYLVRYSHGGVQHERFVGSPDGSGVTLTGNESHVNIRENLRDRMARRRPVGSMTEIMVNPANPAEAYTLDREVPVRVLAWVVSAIFAVFFVIFVVIAFELV